MAVNCNGPRVNVPQVADIRDAVKLYYSKTELSLPDIQALFGCRRSKAQRLKGVAKEAQANDGVQTYDARAVNTKTAYAAWGLDIRDLEDRIGALQRLRLNG